jgi:hypothetical protein
VSNADDANVSGMSDRFRIRAPSVFVTSPRQDDIWWAGRDYYVSWTWQGEFSKVLIEYSTNGGTSWNQVANNIDNDGDYLWRLPGTPTRNGRVRITNVDNAATADTSDEFEIHVTGVEEGKPGPIVPEFTTLDRVGPNPTSSVLGVSYQVARADRVRIAICDITGRTVQVLAAGAAKPGRYTAVWDGCDGQRRSVPAGVYLCVMETGDSRVTRRVTIVR